MKYFNRSEFACNCGCGLNVVDYELAKKLDDIREYFNKPISITSGCRCSEYNKKIGGAKNSQHIIGKAADIKIKDIPAYTVQEYLKDFDGGIGSYANFTHIDVSTKRKW